MNPLAEVARRIPNLEVQMTQGRQSDLIQQLNEDMLDVALLVDDGQLPERVNYWPLFREKYHVVFPADHRLARLGTITLAELAAEIFIGRQCCVFEERFREAAANAGWKLRFQHSCAAEDHVERLVAADMGIAVVPEHLAVRPHLARRPLPELSVDRSVVVATMHGRRHGPAVDHFVRLNRVHPFVPKAAAAQ